MSSPRSRVFRMDCIPPFFAVSEANVSVPSMRAAGGGAAMQAEAVAELTRALGRPPAAVFAHLPSVPAAAASLGQVRARCL